MAEPGWYADADDVSLARWWDGERWSDNTKPMVEVMAPEPPAPITEPSVASAPVAGWGAAQMVPVISNAQKPAGPVGGASFTIQAVHPWRKRAAIISAAVIVVSVGAFVTLRDDNVEVKVAAKSTKIAVTTSAVAAITTMVPTTTATTIEPPTTTEPPTTMPAPCINAAAYNAHKLNVTVNVDIVDAAFAIRDKADLEILRLESKKSSLSNEIASHPRNEGLNLQLERQQAEIGLEQAKIDYQKDKDAPIPFPQMRLAASETRSMADDVGVVDSTSQAHFLRAADSMDEAASTVSDSGVDHSLLGQSANEFSQGTQAADASAFC